MYSVINWTQEEAQEPSPTAANGGFTTAWQAEHAARVEERNRTIEEPDVAHRPVREPVQPQPSLDDSERT